MIGDKFDRGLSVTYALSLIPNLFRSIINSGTLPENLIQSLPDALDDFFVRRKHNPAFLSDRFIADANGKFAATAFDQSGFDAERFFDFSRRTDGSRTIRSSDFAIMDAYVFHNFFSQSFFKVILTVVNCQAFSNLWFPYFLFHRFSVLEEREKPDIAFFERCVRRHCRWRRDRSVRCRRDRAKPS